MATPRKRVSTVYKRYIKEQTGVDTVPTSSKKTFMKQYNEVVGKDDASEPVTSVVEKPGESVISELESEAAEVILSQQLAEAEMEYGTDDISTFFQLEETMNSDQETDNVSTCSSEHVEACLNQEEECSDEECSDNEVEDDNVEEDIPKWDMHSQIFEGAQITLATSLLLILTFATKYSLTSEGVAELLQLINLHSMAVNYLPKTLYAFKKFFGDIKHPLVYHKYCSYCLLAIDSSAAEFCQNELCRKNLKCENSVSGFIEIPIESQIQSLFNRSGFTDKLLYKKNRSKKKKDAVEDIYDGKLYKKLISGGILKNNFDLTFTFNTDGAKPFRSCKTSLWHIYMMINELPFSERKLPENMILAGIWYGNKKPEMAGFLKPFMKSLRKLEQGISVTLNGSEIDIRVILIASTCDLPARACVCCMNQYNGDSSCVKCEQPGKVVKVGKGHTRVFAPEMDNISGPVRTDESVAKHALEAVQLKKPVHGIKGPSWFSFLTFYSFTRSTGIDYMHGILLGVTKMMNSLWFSSKFSKEVFSIAHLSETVNKRLLQIKPPNYMTRLPRSLTDSDYWKASEWKYWLLFYAPAVLYGLLDPKYYEHFLLLSEAVHLLLRDSILPKEIQCSKMLLIRFVAMFPVLYSETNMTLNVHQLLHYPDDVTNIGPLWCFSCFPFEDANGYLLQLFNGTQHIDKQIAHAISTMQKVPELITLIENNSDAYQFYCKMRNKLSKNKCSFLESNIFLVGASRYEKDLPEKFKTCLEIQMSGTLGKVISFKRVKINGDTFFSRAYSRVQLRNSYTVTFWDSSKEYCKPSFGFVELFVQVMPVCKCYEHCNDCMCVPKNFALMNNLNVAEDHFKSSYIKRLHCYATEDIIAVPLHHLKRKCVFIHVDSAEFAFILSFPNTIEKD